VLLLWLALILYFCGRRIKGHAKRLERELAHGLHLPYAWVTTPAGALIFTRNGGGHNGNRPSGVL
jgi:hypothetical protein